MTRAPWRPQLLWLPMVALLGGACGAAVGAALMAAVGLVDPAGGALVGLAALVGVGTVYGAVAGVAVGLAVGLLMVFLVGAHLPRDVARVRARACGHVLPPVVMLGPFLLTGELGAGAGWWLLVPVAAAVLGGPLARWVAGFQPLDLREIHR